MTINRLVEYVALGNPIWSRIGIENHSTKQNIDAVNMCGDQVVTNN